MKHDKTLLVLFFSVLFFSCSIVSFEKLQITCNIPEELNYFSEENILLTFSIKPELKNIENNLNLSVNNSTIECECVWENNTCKIQPKTGWKYGAVYDFKISNSLYMEDGRQYNVDIRRIFYYGDVSSYLQLEKCSIENNAVITKNETLEFSFNNSVDIISFINNFLISPNVTYLLDFADKNKKVIITPVEGWKTNERYTWSLSDIESRDGYPLLKSYSESFYAPQDTVKPEIKAIYPVSKVNETFNWLTNKTVDDMNYDNYLGMEFSEPVDFDSLKNALTITPNIDGYIIQADEDGTKFIYCLENSYWNAEKEYEITIAKSVKDKNDISLYGDYVFYFKPVNTLFQIKKIIIGGVELTQFDEIPVDVQVDEVAPVTVTIEFSKAVSDAYRNKAKTIISLNSYFPSTAISPSVISESWITSSTFEIIYKGFSSSTNDVKNYYLLNISGGENTVLDEFGNFLEESVCVYFIAQ